MIKCKCPCPEYGPCPDSKETGDCNSEGSMYMGCTSPDTVNTPDRIGSAKDRKDAPVTSGVLDYFPDALIAVAQCSKKGNDQHNPGQPLHWAKDKSTDHADCIVRHLIDRGTMDNDGIRHSAKVAWRSLALLQIELEKERQNG